ncbi:peroxide stress protein YaaA [Chitinolyticbacter meiyuanensis]|uniref:peroxide stress protein YaaA n=1 Tax=Chitinolyticbacter meiyuanensis TaxID=682798 RepID=UPI0011E5A1BE|nr:peroxide stress protein YaaA [Chitinolyticbacter meiyuanensis]
MLMLISPAKSLDYASPLPTGHHTQPQYLKQSKTLVKLLKPMAPAELSALMEISDELAVLNAGRYHGWKPPFTPDNARAAVFAFNGDVYEGLDAYSLDDSERQYLERHLRILSGLYGLLQPFDLIQPYRLEMGTRLANEHGKDLYAFWGETLAKAVNKQADKVVVNLASDEYFKSVGARRVKHRLVTPVFEDWKGDRYKIISFYAKRARGLMVRYAAQRGLTEVDELKAFDLDGYRYVADASNTDTWVFRRRMAD